MAQERLEEIRNARLARRQALLDAGKIPYPAEAHRTHTIAETLNNFETLEKDQTAVIVAGRLMGVRTHGSIMFADIHDQSGGLQLQLRAENMPEEEFKQAAEFDVGDWVQVTGKMSTTKRGVQSLDVVEVTMLAKAIRPLPDAWYGLKDQETRYREREVDLLLNTAAREVILKRSAIIHALREYFNTHGYLEVETPILQATVGGAAARPFATHHNTLDIPLQLRIAAELHLKRLLVSGVEKVFEIERRFRNEGISRQHNPEFTMLESQWAFADYEDVMDFTDDLFSTIAKEITGNTTVTWQGVELSFASPMPRKRYVDLVSETVGFDILEEKNPDAYIEVFKKHNLIIPEAPTYPKLVDELYKELIRPNIIQPTHLYDYPVEMVPLAKPKASDPRIAEKTQLVVHGLEVTNCYTELNDPVMQQAFFEDQRRRREAGDEEAHEADDEYVRAMEYGMPPNVGFGLGVDRFVMLLTDSPSIRDVILFPLLKPEK